jgi:hypothetical protein
MVRRPRGKRPFEGVGEWPPPDSVSQSRRLPRTSGTKVGTLRSPPAVWYAVASRWPVGEPGLARKGVLAEKSGVDWSATQTWLAGIRPARQLLDVVVRNLARRRLTAFDHLAGVRCQARVLRGLVHRARNTRFGREHDFRRIRTPADYRRLVPLRTPQQLFQEYGEPPLPDLAPFPGPPGQALPARPLSPALFDCYRAAFWTALGLIAVARPAARPLTGRLLFVGSGLVKPAMVLPSWLRPGQVFPADGDDLGDPLARLAQRSAKLPVTCVAGTTEQLTTFFAHLKDLTGRDRVLDAWPGLTAVIYAAGPQSPGRTRLTADLDSPGVLLMETFFLPEGIIALEDPRHGLLRLLPNHGLYFEFVPLDEEGTPRPLRLTQAEVESGVPYRLVVTSPAGYWACLTDHTVCFECLRPPLLRRLEPASPASPAVVLPLPAIEPVPVSLVVGAPHLAGRLVPEGPFRGITGTGPRR